MGHNRLNKQEEEEGEEEEEERERRKQNKRSRAARAILWRPNRLDQEEEVHPKSNPECAIFLVRFLLLFC